MADVSDEKMNDLVKEEACARACADDPDYTGRTSKKVLRDIVAMEKKRTQLSAVSDLLLEAAKTRTDRQMKGFVAKISEDATWK